MSADTTTSTFTGTGKRKTAVARVRIRPGDGQITVNRRPADEYFGRETSRMQQFVGTDPLARLPEGLGEVPERPKGADCKSAGVSLRWFESTPLHHPAPTTRKRGSSSVGRARAFQARGRGFDSRLPLVAS